MDGMVTAKMVDKRAATIAANLTIGRVIVRILLDVVRDPSDMTKENVSIADNKAIAQEIAPTPQMAATRDHLPGKDDVAVELVAIWTKVDDLPAHDELDRLVHESEAEVLLPHGARIPRPNLRSEQIKEARRSE